MKFTLSWLKDYLETDATIAELTDTLNAIGLEVEDIVNPADGLRAFHVAEIVDAKPHPDADKLKVCTVNTGSEELQIVCGAPNARAGIRVVLGRPGDYVPGIDVTLKAATIRGVESNGMLCSARELELGDDHDGIIELATDAPVGESFVDYARLDDPVIDIAITPNRQDCLGVYGIARDLAAAGLGRLKPLTIPGVESRFESSMTPATPSPHCSMFLAREFRGVKNGPSPDWLKKRLEAVGQRSISILVDVTNYISIAYGRPLHVYDATKLNGALTARVAEKGERFTALNGEEYELLGSETVIADDVAVHGLGGIIGGEDSSAQLETTDIILEAALFDPVATATTGRLHNVNTDARYRFERGVDSRFVADGIALASQMILDLCGGEAGSVQMGGEQPKWDKTVAFRPGRVMELGGLALSESRMTEILEALGFTAAKDGEVWTVTVPSWRTDVDGEADIVEEILRIEGLDNIPSVPLPAVDHRAGDTLSNRQKRSRTARRVLASRGLHEAVTWSFVSQDHAKQFGGGDERLLVDNPISSELDCMRPSILPSLALAAGRNRDRSAESVALFEVGPVYQSDQPEGQLLIAGLLRAFKNQSRHWESPARDVNVFDIKADVEAVLAALGVPTASLRVMEAISGHYHPGRSGTLRLGPKMILAEFGELHPATIQAMGLKGAMAGAEIFLDRIAQKKKKGTAKPALAISNLQSVERDFAFILPADTSAQDLINAALGADKKYITEVRVFDRYEGPGVEKDHVSLAIAVTITPQEKTFTDSEIEAISAKVVDTADKKLGAKLRQ